MSLIDATRLTIWFEGSVPYGLVWEGRHYRVTDTPTRLEDEVLGFTHPLDIIGWRFQGTDDDDRSRMFDVRQLGGEWIVVRVYD
ncbi:hypothetical protein M2152_001606 [Microbacteriaceae bacterium SG_E_30_P1]|uniref:Uncharacterized protein n=1 Tax=Antiquaquibacter oligotrophicus TaxID=2880260 RepID=A0ABT6KN40_9MICO|nr:hypothetical protein [Antiquaquibacter oligotrophicus]MDH6181424.1 hypothetical protein [Antiquaquibacter oligotrophicus]UDF12884.1 hypothetical protein LH407_12085 [Antiquaquibacter oligotrophicus]